MQIAKLIPEGDFKNKLRCWYYRHPDFKIRYENGYFINAFSDWRFFKTKEFIFTEAKNIKRYLKHYTPKEGDTVLDAGAHVGSFSLYISQFVKDVYAYEPDKKNFELLSHNISLNGFSNIIPVTAGLWSRIALLDLEGDGANAHLTEKVGNTPVIDLDNAEFADKISFIKMDIEGAEIEALKGMKEILSRKVPIAIASYHLKDGWKEIETVLKGYGYKTETVFDEHQTTYGY